MSSKLSSKIYNLLYGEEWDNVEPKVFYYPNTLYNTMYNTMVEYRQMSEYNQEEKKLEYNIPGVDKKDIKLEIKGKELILEINNEKYKKYNRTFTIPDNLNTDDLNAIYLNGV